VCALESINRKHKIESLKAQLESSQNVCSSVTHEFETTTLTGEQKAEIAHRREDALRECKMLQLAIDLLERQEGKERHKSEF
jgi:hypothetical protein